MKVAAYNLVRLASVFALWGTGAVLASIIPPPCQISSGSWDSKSEIGNGTSHHAWSTTTCTHTASTGVNEVQANGRQEGRGSAAWEVTLPEIGFHATPLTLGSDLGDEEVWLAKRGFNSAGLSKLRNSRMVTGAGSMLKKGGAMLKKSGLAIGGMVKKGYSMAASGVKSLGTKLGMTKAKPNTPPPTKGSAPLLLKGR